MRKDAAWELLSPEVRQELYNLLPAPKEGEAPHDIDVHPLKTSYKQHIEEELRRWQTDLKDGKEVKKWRQEAMEAGQERANGEWDELLKQVRDDEWKKDATSDVTGNNGKAKEEDSEEK